jgi:hypothetical protein
MKLPRNQGAVLKLRLLPDSSDMKHRSNKTAAIYRQWTPVRNQFLFEYPNCAFCGERGGCSVHEILSGTGYRMLAFVSRACWLPACWDCNSNKATDRKLWPVEKQLALKLLIDPLGFDQDEVDRIYAPRRIDWAQVLREYSSLRRFQLESDAA